MRFHVFVGTDGSLLFAAKEHETDGAPRKEPRRFDGARGLDDECRIAAVVERACTQFPGIEMRGKNDGFVWLFVAANLADNILLFDRPTALIGHIEMDSHFPWVRCYSARQPHRIAPPEDVLPDLVNFSSQSIRVASLNHPLPRSHP